MGRLKLRLLIACVAILACGSPSQAAKPKRDWNPAKTWVFVAGLLEWEHPEIWSSFPNAKKDRRDQQLTEFFRESGVPGEQIVYLKDAEATKQRIDKEFVKLLDKTDSGDLLVFYFCGHGYRDIRSGQIWFANYDAGKKSGSAWSVPSIYSTIEEHFSGSRVLLLADCCHSGALYDEAYRHRDSKIAYAALTSSYSHNLSTGNWTFSDSVLSGLRGEGLADLNGDQVISLEEMAGYTELELAFIEGQKSMFFASQNFPRMTTLSSVAQPTKPRMGQRLEVNYKGTWYKAKTIGAKDNQLRIHYTNYDDSWDEWVGPDRIRPYQPTQFAAGDKIDVQWSSDRKWYPATVRKAWYGLHFIHYDGYDDTWDEWVGPRSIRLRMK